MPGIIRFEAEVPNEGHYLDFLQQLQALAIDNNVAVDFIEVAEPKAMSELDPNDYVTHAYLDKHLRGGAMQVLPDGGQLSPVISWENVKAYSLARFGSPVMAARLQKIFERDESYDRRMNYCYYDKPNVGSAGLALDEMHGFFKQRLNRPSYILGMGKKLTAFVEELFELGQQATVDNRGDKR